MNADVTVRDVMDREYVGVSESDDLVETAELLLAEDADTAVVLRGSDPVGVLTCRDVLTLLVDGADLAAADVADAMTDSVPTVDPDLGLEAAADMMSARDARRLVVTETGGAEPLGILTEHDVLITRPLGRTREERQAVAEPAAPGGDAATLSTESDREADAGFEDQSICESCGTLTSDLASFNGQLICGDCRDI
jgi:CBS domain-containing protein